MTSGCIGQVYSASSPALAPARDRTPSGARDGDCCAMALLHVTNATALTVMAAICFRISSGCRAGASPASGETRQPQRLPYKQYAIATALRDERRSVSEKALLQDQFSERKCAGWAGVE